MIPARNAVPVVKTLKMLLAKLKRESASEIVREKRMKLIDLERPRKKLNASVAELKNDFVRKKEEGKKKK